VQAQTGAARPAGELGIRPVELLEDPALLGESDSGTWVCGGDPDHAVDSVRIDLHGALSVLDGVVEQVDQDLLKPVAIAREGSHVVRDPALDSSRVDELFPERTNRL